MLLPLRCGGSSSSDTLMSTFISRIHTFIQYMVLCRRIQQIKSIFRSSLPARAWLRALDIHPQHQVLNGQSKHLVYLYLYCLHSTPDYSNSHSNSNQILIAEQLFIIQRVIILQRERDKECLAGIRT
jgi:hypothetical protein